MFSPNGDKSGPTIERQIGGTKYIVTSTYSKNATETAVDKMRRLILKDAENVSEYRKYTLKTAGFHGIIYTWGSAVTSKGG